MRRFSTGFALTSLALILASCGSSNTPVASQPAPAGLVKFDVAASYAGGSNGVVRGQGLSGLGLSGTLPDAFFNVQVRDSANNLVAFNGGTFDPTGQGSKTVVLNTANTFRQTLLLPAGTYTFENALKDTAGSALLAYGPAGENTATISGDSAAVRLKFHAVFDKANSALDFSTNTARLFTNSTFNLSLRPMTSPVGSLQAGVPTADIGPVTYALGNATDGVFNGAGSKIGVNVTARGTVADSTLNVTASFSAWVRNAGTDTASFVPTSLDFTKAIETNAVVVDTTAPIMTFATVSAAFQGSATTLSGTATDDIQVQDIRVYADSQLVASTVTADGVSAITSASNGDWSASWTPTSTGSQALSVVVSDSSGNESRADQDVTVALRDYDLLLNGEMPNMRPFTIPANGDLWIKVDRSSTGDNHLDIYMDTSGTTGTTATSGSSKVNQTVIPSYGSMYEGNTGVIAGAFYIHLTNSTSQPIDGDVSSMPY